MLLERRSLLVLFTHSIDVLAGSITIAFCVLVGTAGDAHAQELFRVKLVPSSMDQGWAASAHDQLLLQGGDVFLAAISRCSDDLSQCTSNGLSSAAWKP